MRKMPKKTEAALRASIAHWEELIAAKNKDELRAIGCEAKACALCHLFILDNCQKCPVKQHSGEVGCINTPYVEAGKYFHAYVRGDSQLFSLRKWRALARKELAFLKSLLPEGTKP